MMVYAEMTNGRGVMPITLRIVDANEDREPVFEITSQVQMQDPLAVTQFGIAAEGLVFPEAGDYRAQLICGSHILLERRLLICADETANRAVNTGVYMMLPGVG